MLFMGLTIPAAGEEDLVTRGAGVARAAPPGTTPTLVMLLLILCVSWFIEDHGGWA
jgi:hypothetical protein